MMQPPTSAPVDWRQRYGFADTGTQKQMLPATADYWTLNIGNGGREAIATNMMPYVMNPAHTFADGQVPDARASNMANMYSAPTSLGQNGQQGFRAATDPMTQILGLIQQNPQLVPLLLQNLQGQQGG